MPESPSGRPFVVAKIAQSCDGKVALRNGQSKWITSRAARDFARRRRDSFQAILVGADTLIKDNPRLTGVRRENLMKVVVDTTLRVSPRLQIFQTPDSCLIATTRRASPEKVNRFERRGVPVLLCPQKRRRVSLPHLFNKLEAMGISRLLMEGGPTLIGSALRDDLVDRLNIYIAPKIIGDAQALDGVIGVNPLRLDKLLRLRNMRTRSIKPDLLLEADVYRHR